MSAYVKGIPEVVANLKMYQIIKTQAIKDRLKKQAFKIELSAKEGCPVDTGRLRASISTNWAGSPMNEGKTDGKAKSGDGIKKPTGPKELVYVVGTNVEYGCVIGSRQQVYEPLKKTSSNIGNYPYNTVLSKDGKPHKIITHHKFYEHPVYGVEIRIRDKRNPLRVTRDHLILIIRNDFLMWEKASKIEYTDQVLTKRAHNYISDNSNKTKYICPCGAEFYIKNSYLKRRKPKYCSLKCRHKYGPHDLNTGQRWTLSKEKKQRYMGKNNPQWRDGSAKRKYPSEFNENLKAIVKERDRYKCQFCGDTKDLVVHHIDWNKMNNEINNLITLCRHCHGQLNHIDCELPSIDFNIFKPINIKEIKHFEMTRKKKERVPYLYDFTVENENSFMVSGMMVHNSSVEHGTSKREATPYLFPAYFMHEGETVAALAVIMKKDVRLK